MMPVDFSTVAQECAPAVHPVTMQAIVHTESGFNPYAIGVVGGRLVRQPRDLNEAVATAKALEAGGWNYSMGLAQVNRANLVRYGLDTSSVFDPCANLRAGAAILSDCYSRASSRNGAGQAALLAAVSCYYSGNFQRGFQQEGHSSYVQRVRSHVAESASVPAAAGTGEVRPIPVVPALDVVKQSTRPSPAGEVVKPVAVPGVDSSSVPVRRQWDVFGDF